MFSILNITSPSPKQRGTDLAAHLQYDRNLMVPAQVPVAVAPVKPQISQPYNYPKHHIFI